MKWLVVWKQFVDYRALEGITRKIYQFSLIPEYPDYTTIYMRISDLVPEISLPEFDEVEIATDGSGLKTSNVGEYRILKYGDKDARRKKHLVVIITADVKKPLCVEVHIEGKEHTETSIAMEHLSILAPSVMRIKRFYGDGAFDQSTLLDKLHSIGTKPIIKIRKNAFIDYYNGCKYSRMIVREYKIWGMKDDTH
ncbi:MAG: transposase [Thermoplasmata archaeon]